MSTAGIAHRHDFRQCRCTHYASEHDRLGGWCHLLQCDCMEFHDRAGHTSPGRPFSRPSTAPPYDQATDTTPTTGGPAHANVVGGDAP